MAFHFVDHEAHRTVQIHSDPTDKQGSESGRVNQAENAPVYCLSIHRITGGINAC
jgi:hypothetical protein